jgi:hypothetical protein
LWSIAALPVGKQAAVDADAPAAIVAALRAHSSVTAVAEFGCRALHRVAALPVGKQAAVDTGAPAAIIAALRAHPGVNAVAEAAKQALAALGHSQT